MLKTKFLDILKTFSGEDCIKFGEFIRSEYFNKSETTRRLYEIILENYSTQPGKELNKEDLFKKLYPGKKYNESRLINLFSGLYKLSEEYIAHQTYKEDSFAK